MKINPKGCIAQKAINMDYKTPGTWKMFSTKFMEN